MSSETTTVVKFNPSKIKAVRGELSRSEFAEKIGLKPDFIGKVERGMRDLSIKSLEKLCARTNKMPDFFFDIEVKKS